MDSKKNKVVEVSILKTLTYANIFNCSLSKKELFELAISEKKFTKNQLDESIKKLLIEGRVEELTENDLVIYRPIINTKGDVENISRRNISQDKFKKNRIWKKWLFKIPWIEAVFITGSCAANNANEMDDIDILIITTPKRLWLSRFLVTLMLQFLGIRRKPESETTLKNKNIFFKDLICANMYIDSSDLNIFLQSKNIYIARELIQAKIIFDKTGILTRLFEQNRWVNEYTPHSPAILLSSQKHKTNYKGLKLIDFIDRISFLIQNNYMKKKMTKEVVLYSHALFHPRDTSKIVLNSYQKNLKKLYVLRRN